MSPEFYFDHNSTSPISDGIAQRIRPYLTSEFGNPSSLGTELGRTARAAIDTARRELSGLLGSESHEIVFTSGGTESCFSALIGALRTNKHHRHLIISAVEHPAVVEAANFAAEMCGAEITVVAVEPTGALDVQRIIEAIRPNTGLMSFMLANNETGVMFPIQEIVALAHSRGIQVHTDAVQAVGKIPVDFQALGVDLLSLSAHKFGALKGCGALLISKSARWEPVVKGGGQESGRRGGTEAVPLIVALGEAALERRQALKDKSDAQMRETRDYFEALLQERISGLSVNGMKTDRLPNTSSIRIEGVVAQEILPALASRGVIVSAGSACKTSTVEPSKVLNAMGLSLLEAMATLRFSFGLNTSRESVSHAVDILAETVAYFRAHASEKLQRSLNG